MSVENSMVVGAQDEYDNLNREPTVCEQRKVQNARRKFISRILSGHKPDLYGGERFDLGDVWELMPPDFLDEYKNTDDETLCKLFLSAKLGKWLEAIQIAAGKLADHAGYEE